MSTANSDERLLIILIAAIFAAVIIALGIRSIISGFAGAIVELLLNVGLPSSIAEPIGSLIFYGIVIGLIVLVLKIIFR